MSRDDARQVAFNVGAPPGERFDANAELGRIYRPLASALIPPEDLRPVIAAIQDGLAESEMMKARSQVIQFPGNRTIERGPGMKSVYIDDLQIFANGEFFEKPSALGFDALRTMVDQTPILSSVVMTRIRQVSQFTQPSNDGGLGFEVRHIDKRHKMGPEEQQAAQLLTRFFQNCGWEFSPRKRKALKRDNFAGFMAKSIRDSLSMDASPIETEMKRNRALGIDGFYAVDGATIRLCTEHGYDGDDSIFALQVIQGRLATAYTLDNLIYEVRNPRADVRLAGYGLGEPELLVRVVTGFLNAMTYNMRGLDENAIPKGLLHLSGEYSQEDLGAFKRYWNAMVKGINNAWTLPVMVSSSQESKASFERFGIEFDEMYFSKWMLFLTSLICAIYGMDPAEINFDSFSAQASSLSGSDTAERLANSKDKGLLPLMAFYEATLTDFIVTEFDQNFCFRWVGLKEEDQDQLFEKQKLVMRTDELRAEMGLSPDPLYGDAPLNPALVGAWMAKQQQAMQPQQPQGDFGQPPADDARKGAQGDQGQNGDAGGAADASHAAADGGSPGEQRAQSASGTPGGEEFGSGAQGEFGKALQIYNVEV